MGRAAESVKYAQKIDLSKNELTFFSNTTSIKSRNTKTTGIDLSNNKIESIDFECPSNLRELNLRNNRLITGQMYSVINSIVTSCRYTGYNGSGLLDLRDQSPLVDPTSDRLIATGIMFLSGKNWEVRY